MQLPKVQHILVVIFLCVFSEINSQENLELQSILLDSTLTKDANAIVRSEDIVVEINSINSVTIRSKRIVTILNKYGNKYAKSYQGYDSSRNIKKLQLTVYNALGKEINKYKKKDFSDRSAVSAGTLFSDDRIKYVDYTPTGYPYSIVFESEIESSITAYIRPWVPISGYSLSVQKSTFRVLNPTKIPIRNKEERFNGYNIKMSKENMELFYEMSNVPASSFEVQAPSFYNIFPIARIALNDFSLDGIEGSAKDWKSLGKWEYDHLIAGRDQLPEKTLKEVEKLMIGADTKREKAKRIYNYVQNKTRYISVQLGIGGLIPFLASDVDKWGYGDCKALTNYTKALLKSQNIESYYTELYAGQEKRDMDDEFASIEGNHVILNIPDEEEDIWLECTSQTAPFNFIGDFTDDRNVLVLKPEGGEIKRTKKYSPEENTLHTTATISLLADASIKAEVVSISKGLQYDWRYLTKLEPIKDQKLYYKEYWDHINNLNIVSIELEDDKDSISYQEHVKIDARNYATKVGSRLLIMPNIFNRITRKMPRYKDRKTPLVISRGYVDVDEYIIKVPEGYAINKLPEKKVFETIFGKYSCSIEKVDESTLKYSRNLLIKDGEHPKEKYEDYRQFMAKLRTADKTKIILKQL
ncbi:DUF3857 domain-containing protein [Aquimarina litoralis]|uniref:DUF3857 domain-containing protein n=1 Tax=Aquimarina litoralis TaxID=584605 RepID=UPI001C58A9D9|nr:DUF3857 domain-containing protein [Aquimarina litoralis]MBW1294312.1 DUF3857 domain-containing protein [Aquimarina litoralis]